jgi:hypothetical protein
VAVVLEVIMGMIFVIFQKVDLMNVDLWRIARDGRLSETCFQMYPRTKNCSGFLMAISNQLY